MLRKLSILVQIKRYSYWIISIMPNLDSITQTQIMKGVVGVQFPKIVEVMLKMKEITLKKVK